MAPQAGTIETPKYATAFNAVYHLAILNHWRAVAEEQLPLLLENRNLAALYVTIGVETRADVQAAVELLNALIQKMKGELAWHCLRVPLRAYEHRAMILIDEVARRDRNPVLYFHGKGVSHAPPIRDFEAHRRYINQIVAEADRWSEFLAHSQYDACGPLLYLDQPSGIQFFAGNFWLARAEYLRELIPYVQFARHPGGFSTPWKRHLAEMAVNRMRRMKGHAIDGISLTDKTFGSYMDNRFGERPHPRPQPPSPIIYPP